MAWFGPRTRQRPRNARPTRPGRYRPVLEPLEDRLAPAIFTVNTPTDTGFGIGLAGDLRYCLTQANATSGLDIIRFNIPGSGLHTINVTSELPSIFDPVVLDGYSQPGSSPNTLAVGDNAVLTIELNGSGAGAAAQGLALFSAGSTVRGLVINRFAFNGIYLSPAADGNTIEGNFLGTDPSGTVARGNGGSGISVDNAATNNTLGGTTPAARNLISGNQLEGIFMSGPGNVVQGNYLGTDVTGTVAQGNIADGVFIGGAATNNVIGGTEPGAGNVIAYNRKGVVLTGTATTGNRILGNAIFANAAMGIDLGDDGVTLNDASGHSGPNNFQNFPVLTQVTASGNGRTVFGHLRSTQNTTFALDFFANAAFDPSGYGQGEVYLGSVTVTTDASGFAAFSFAYVADPAQPFLTSTATDPAGNTSEFSGRDLPPVFNVPGPQQTLESVPLTINASVGDADSDGADTFQVTLTVSHGILTIPSLAGLTGTGNGTANLTYTGTLDALLSAVGAGVIYTPDAGFEGTDTLFLTVNDLVARELGGPGITTSSIAITTHRTALRSLTVGDVTGTVGQAIPLLIQASTADTDVPETLSIEISGLPAGATLSAGTDEGNGVWRLTVDQLNGLTLTIPDSFSGTLTVTATTTLVATGATATTKRTFVVNATTPPSAVLSPPPSPAPAVEVPVFVPKAVPAPVPVSLAPLLEPLLLGPTVTAVLSRASSQSAPPVSAADHAGGGCDARW